MRGGSVLRRLALLLGYSVLLVSGVYVFVYLYRWEWNRALIAGVFFLATQVTLVAVAVLDHLRRIEERLAARPGQPPEVLLEEELAPGDHFAWLRETQGAGVFVPVLLGAGVALTALAWLVECMAAATARGALARRMPARPAVVTAPPRRGAWRSAAAIVIPALVVLVGVDRLGDLTQDRPDVLGGEVATRVVLEVETRDGTGVTDAAGRLWAACETTLTAADARLGAVRAGQVTVTVTPPVGRYAERRLRGCLEDATLDHVQARVVSVAPVPR